MDIQMTNSTRAFLCLIYKEYLTRLKNGATRQEAKDFAGNKKCAEALFPSASPADIGEAISELKQLGFIKLYFGQNFLLENAAIIYMENLFPSGIADILRGTEKLASWIKLFLPDF